MPTLELPDNSLRLDRYPLGRNDPLQPWDAADEYLLKQVREGGDPTGGVLVVNDAFGALAAGLHDLAPATWSDSHLARLALDHNLALNDLAPDRVTFVPGHETPTGPFGLVLVKIPKSLDWLKDSLLRLRPHLLPGSRVMAGGMIKHTPARAYRLLEEIIGPVKTSLGWKKARLATADFDAGRECPPRLAERTYRVENFGLHLVSGPNVFSRGHLDLGTRLFLENLPAGSQPWRVADLGCGNGVLALAVALRMPAATILGVDESFQAVASATRNLAVAGVSGREIEFTVGDGLADQNPESLDAVVCNPPFHMARAVGDQTAWRMFQQARRALVPGGELRIVGNRHLGYHVKLKRLFGNCEVLAADGKFVVLRAVR